MNTKVFKTQRKKRDDTNGKNNSKRINPKIKQH